MTDDKIKTWMRKNKESAEDGAQLAENYCDELDAWDDDGEVPDDINSLAEEVWAETDDDDE